MAPDVTETATFGVTLGRPEPDYLGDGFNEFGIRENERDDGSLESIDVRFRAMEPGVRKNIEVDEAFLSGIAEGFSGPDPAMLDHDKSQLSQIGTVTDVVFTDALGLEVNIPNTGNQTKADVIADFTHDTPQITDGSVGFDPRTLEFGEPTTEDALARFVSGDFTEFSLTPFPAGYDEGGLSPAFSEAVDSFVETADSEKAVSQLNSTQNNSQLI